MLNWLFYFSMSMCIKQLFWIVFLNWMHCRFFHFTSKPSKVWLTVGLAVLLSLVSWIHACTQMYKSQYVKCITFHHIIVNQWMFFKNGWIIFLIFLGAVFQFYYSVEKGAHHLYNNVRKRWASVVILKSACLHVRPHTQWRYFIAGQLLPQWPARK